MSSLLSMNLEMKWKFYFQIIKMQIKIIFNSLAILILFSSHTNSEKLSITVGEVEPNLIYTSRVYEAKKDLMHNLLPYYEEYLTFSLEPELVISHSTWDFYYKGGFLEATLVSGGAGEHFAEYRIRAFNVTYYDIKNTMLFYWH